MNQKAYRRVIAAACVSVAFSAIPAQARTLCTVVADASDGRIVQQEGHCADRYTPASTFKIPLGLMGFDAGVLQDEHAPSWPFQLGYADWGGDEWRKPADPSRWIKFSIVWYSQQIVTRLGQARFQKYTSAFGYGNQDVSNKPGGKNGAQGAWIMSSLRISPLEQIEFLRSLVNRQLPVSAHAFDMTERIFKVDGAADGWQFWGKTGTGSPGENGTYDRDRAYGWFVGWARKDGRQLVFARLIQDEQAMSPAAGMRARDQLIANFPALVAGVSP